MVFKKIFHFKYISYLKVLKLLIMNRNYSYDVFTRNRFRALFLFEIKLNIII